MKRLKGLYKDGDPVDQPPETYRDALNINVNESIGSISTEKGTRVLTVLPQDHVLLGSHLLSDGRIVVFSINTTTDVSQMGIIEPESNTYTPLITNEAGGVNVDAVDPTGDDFLTLL